MENHDQIEDEPLEESNGSQEDVDTSRVFIRRGPRRDGILDDTSLSDMLDGFITLNI